MRPLTVWNAYLAAQEAILRQIDWMENSRPALSEIRAAQSYFDRRVRLRDRCALRISAALRELSKVGGLAPERMTAVELTAIAERAEEATPAPWHVRHLDDTNAMSLVAVSTTPDTGRGERWPAFDHGEIVAATLIQEPRYVDIADQRWDENARFIAHARQDVPRLLGEIARLRDALENTTAAAHRSPGEHSEEDWRVCPHPACATARRALDG